MAYFEQVSITDAVTLHTSIAMVPTVGPAIDTTGYGNIVVQVDTESQIQALMEGSHDQVDWFPIFMNPLNDLAVTDSIINEGGYQFKSTFKYVRYNLSYCGGGDGCQFIILGRAGPGASASDNLAAAFNPDTPLQVAFGNGVKQDKNGALILSDGIPYYLMGGNTYVINLNGYSSIILQLSGALTVSSFQSIDGTLWTTSFFGLVTGNGLTSTPNSAGIWAGPVVGQYLKLVVSGAVGTTITASVILKQTPMNGSYFNSGNLPVNVGQFNGTTTVTAGVAGMLAVGGNIGQGVAPTANPVLVGGIDTGGLTRRILTDIGGRPIANVSTVGTATVGAPYITNFTVSNTAYPLSSNTAYPQNIIGVLPSTFQQSAALNVQDTAQYEGQTQTELLAQILLELRILNQQIYELPKALATNNYNDPPEELRKEPSIFNQ
jgi:hypothetical protein